MRQQYDARVSPLSKGLLADGAFELGPGSLNPLNMMEAAWMHVGNIRAAGALVHEHSTVLLHSLCLH